MHTANEEANVTQIALVNFHGFLGAQLGMQFSNSLRTRNYRVALFDAGRSIVQAWNHLGILPDVLYLYVQSPNGRAEQYLDQLQAYWSSHGPRPLALCVLESYFGAHYQLALEKRSARVAYVPYDWKGGN
jgi:hypothetical protein